MGRGMDEGKYRGMNNFVDGFRVGRSTVEQKNSTSLPSDNAKAQDTGQQNNQGKGSFNGPDGFCDQFTVDFHTVESTSHTRRWCLTDKKKPHIKKPLNAFMLYMKEMRAKVVAECTLKESAAINQILGRRVSRWNYYISFRSVFV